MRVNLEKMRFSLGKILILLTIALAIANAQCFAYCLTQADAGASHCHQKPGHCSSQHDLKAPSVRTVAPVGGAAVVLTDRPELAANAIPRLSVVAFAAPPASTFDQFKPLPLRV